MCQAETTAKSPRLSTFVHMGPAASICEQTAHLCSPRKVQETSISEHFGGRKKHVQRPWMTANSPLMSTFAIIVGIDGHPSDALKVSLWSRTAPPLARCALKGWRRAACAALCANATTPATPLPISRLVSFCRPGTSLCILLCYDAAGQRSVATPPASPAASPQSTGPPPHARPPVSAWHTYVKPPQFRRGTHM